MVNFTHWQQYEQYSLVKERPNAWFEFEATWPNDAVRQWTYENRKISVYLGIAYFCLLFIGRYLMKDRAPFKLRGALAAWNVWMAAFSIMVTVRVGPYFLKRLNIPLYLQVCLPEYEDCPVLGTWHDIFVLTKPMEFIDTLFIVLRKQHLHFLHWYHHITVVILCYFSLGVPQIAGNVIFYVALNGFVHSIMYSYYCLRSARIHVPRLAQMSITIMQIAQMVVGLFINLSVVYYKTIAGRHCESLDENTYLALTIYGSYFYLFAKFFIEFYFGKKPNPKTE